MVSHYKRIWMIFILLFILILPAKGAVKVFDLQCEYLTDPLGIDVEVPRFSWKLSDTDNTRGQYQTGYQILVASDTLLLRRDQADVWDSGLVYASRSVLVPYGGGRLCSGQDCYWKVRVTDKDGNISGWSPYARFSMGLLSLSDWKGSWIKHPAASVEKHIWFRKNITVRKKLASAFIYVASVGYHELYVNGEKVDSRILAPSLSRLDKRIFYVTYDITKALQTGDNVIALWCGPGWSRYSYFKTHPALRGQLNATTTDGEKIVLSSDTTWRCRVSSSENTGDTKFTDNGGEAIDVARYISNWNKTGFDDSRWIFAGKTTIDAALSSQMIEPTCIIDTIHVKNITGSGPWRIDMGKNFSGWLRIDMHDLASGDTVVIRTADDSLSVQDNGQISLFISDGRSVGTFQNRFNYMAGRYITLEGLKSKPDTSDITGYVIGTDMKRTGHFFCSDSLFNQIYETDLWTFRANTIEGYTSDCPHRERLGYGEENFATAWGCGLPNYKAGAFYTKVVRDWCDVQEKNGWINHTAPQINEHFGGPMWSSAPLNISWEFYQAFGDKRLLELSYSTCKRWLDFLASSVLDGLLRPYKEHWGKFLGDWLAPDMRTERGDSQEALFFNNCVYAMNLQTFIQVAGILGRTDDISYYSKQLEQLRKEIQVHFFDFDKNSYMEGHQIQLAFPLMTDITPDSLKSKVYANFEDQILNKRPYLDMGSSGVPVLLKFLIENKERNDILYDLFSKKTQPSYGYFISRGETTWPEYWSGDVDSKIHTCYTGIASWFIKGLGGIHSDPEHPGYKSFIVKPGIEGDLTFANTTVESAYGKIENNWTREGDLVRINLTIPVNSCARVYIPARDLKDITESGSDVHDAEGVKFLKMEGTYAVFLVQSGKYRFRAVLSME